MLLYVCDRCKFTTPGSEPLCQTCGAKFKKEEAVKEIVYRINETEKLGIGAIFSRGVEALGELISVTKEAMRSNKIAKNIKTDIARIQTNDGAIPVRVRIRRL